jgi:hypothetical protein
MVSLCKPQFSESTFMKKFRTGVVLICAAVCVILTTGCAIGTWANVVKKERHKIKEEARLKKLGITPEILEAIGPNYQIVDKTNYFGSIFLACRSTDLKDETRYIFYDSVIEDLNPLFDEATAEIIPIAIVKDGHPEVIRLSAPITFSYKWTPIEIKPMEFAVTREK